MEEPTRTGSAENREILQIVGMGKGGLVGQKRESGERGGEVARQRKSN